MVKLLRIDFKDMAKKDKNLEQKLHEERIDKLTEFIRQSFSPIGKTEDKEFKTTADIQYMYDNIMSLSASDIAEAMAKAGFRIEYVGGQPYWVMYTSNFDLR